MEIKNILESKSYSSFMLIIVFGYALFSIEFHRIGNIFLGLLLIGSLPLFSIYKNKIFKDPIIIILILVLILEVFSWLNSLIYLPEFANNIPKLDRLSKLFIFFFIAYWLKGSLKNITLLWLFFIFGFLLAIMINSDIQSIFQFGLKQTRADFSIKNAQWDAMLAGTSLLMSLVLFYTTVQSVYISSKLKISLLFSFFLLIVLFSYFVLITQTRQVWLGLIGVSIIGPISYLVIHKITNLKVLLITILLIIGTLFLFSNSKIVKERLSTEQTTIHAIFNKNEPIKMSSIGIRVNSWIEATEWIKRHPFLGLDSQAIPEVINQSTKFDENLKKRFGHLHNFFIETLVAYGLIGLFLILALYYFVIKNTQTSSLTKDERKFYLLLSICFTTYWLIINNFETFNSRHLGVFAHNIVLASFYTFYITDNLKCNTK